MSQVTCRAHKTFGRGFSNEVQMVKLTWDFTTDGGASADTHKMGTTNGKILVLDSRVHVETAALGTNATMIIGVSGGDTDAFLDSTSGAQTSLTDDSVHSETAGQGLVLASGAVIEADIATANMTAGKVNLILRYVNID